MQYELSILENQEKVLKLQNEVLKLQERVLALEEKIERLEAALEEAPKADSRKESSRFDESRRNGTARYLWEGKAYKKNRLVLAVVKQYVDENPGISAEELMSTFPKRIQGSLGVVRTMQDAGNTYADCDKRFFVKPDEIIRTASEDCVVCTQWTAQNIEAFLKLCEEKLGLQIQEEE